MSDQERFNPFRRAAQGLFVSVTLLAVIMLCDTAIAAQTACDTGKKQTCEQLVQDNILWRISEPDNPASKHWAQENLDNLCSCTTDPYETVNCFQVQVNNNRKTWQEAVLMCRAKQ